MAKRINDMCAFFDISLEVVWRRRSSEDIVLCDKLSKTFDLGEYRLERNSFERIEREFGPFEVDWFASSWSHRLPEFASRFWTLGASWTDAFCHDWSKEVGFFHPPLDQLARVMDHIGSYGAMGVVVLPDWPGSEKDSIMRQAGNLVETMGVRQVEFESPAWRQDEGKTEQMKTDRKKRGRWKVLERRKGD